MFNFRGFRLLSLSLFSTILTSLTMVLGAIPLRQIHQIFGAYVFWPSQLLLAIGLFALEPSLSFAYLTLLVLVGAFRFAEQGADVRLFAAGAFSISASIAVILLSLGAWQSYSGVPISEVIKAKIEGGMILFPENPGREGLTVDEIFAVLPAIAICSLIASLCLSLVFDRVRKPRLSKHSLADEIGQFKVPPAFIWIACAAALGYFLNHSMEWLNILSLNALYVISFLYFLQGMAVVSYLFSALRIGPGWRFILYLLLFLQLYVVSLVGFTDYWLEFRERIFKKVSEKNSNLSDKG